MRPVRFVALSEDGQALVLADEVGRLLALPIDDRVSTRACTPTGPPPPRDDRPRPDDAAVAVPARHPGPHPLRRVRRGRGPHRRRAGRPGAALRRPGAAGAGHARPARPAHPAARPPRRAPRSPRWSTAGWASTASTRRRSPGTPTGATTAPGAIVATWPSGKATAQAVWELDKARQVVAPSRRHGAVPVRRAADPDPGPGPAPRATRSAPPRPEPRRPRPARGGRRRAPARPRPDPRRPRRAARLARASARARPPAAASTRRARPRWPPAASAAAVRRGAARAGGVRRLRTRTTPTRPRRCRPCRRWPCCGRAATAPRPRRDRPTATSRASACPSWDDVLFGARPDGRRTPDARPRRLG